MKSFFNLGRSNLSHCRGGGETSAQAHRGWLEPNQHGGSHHRLQYAAYLGRTEAVSQLLSQQDVDINCQLPGDDHRADGTTWSSVATQQRDCETPAWAPRPWCQPCRFQRQKCLCACTASWEQSGLEDAVGSSRNFQQHDQRNRSVVFKVPLCLHWSPGHPVTLFIVQSV